MSINEAEYKKHLQSISVDAFDKLFESAKDKPEDAAEKDSLEESLNYLVGYGSCADILLEFLPSKFKDEKCFNEFIRGWSDAWMSIKSKIDV